MSPNKPKTKSLIFPIQQIDYFSTKLQRDLRRIKTRLQKGELDKQQARLLGEAAITESFQKLEQQIKYFLRNNGLFVQGDRADLEKGLQDALTSWRHIIEQL
jgi:hypothetical protein